MIEKHDTQYYTEFFDIINIAFDSSFREDKYNEMISTMPASDLINETSTIAFQCMYIYACGGLEDNDPLRQHDCHWQLQRCFKEWEKRDIGIAYLDIVSYVYDCEFGFNDYFGLEINHEL